MLHLEGSGGPLTTSQFFRNFSAIFRNFSQFSRNFSAIFRNWIRPPQTAISPPPLPLMCFPSFRHGQNMPTHEPSTSLRSSLSGLEDDSGTYSARSACDFTSITLSRLRSESVLGWAAGNKPLLTDTPPSPLRGHSRAAADEVSVTDLTLSVVPGARGSSWEPSTHPQDMRRARPLQAQPVPAHRLSTSSSGHTGPRAPDQHATARRVVAAAIRHVAPKLCPSAAVLFADLVGFTSLAAQTEPWTLVHYLDRLFGQMDAACQAQRVEKIKTIGDCYMCVGWTPEVLSWTGRVSTSHFESTPSWDPKTAGLM